MRPCVSRLCIQPASLDTVWPDSPRHDAVRGAPGLGGAWSGRMRRRPGSTRCRERILQPQRTVSKYRTCTRSPRWCRAFTFLPLQAVDLSLSLLDSADCLRTSQQVRLPHAIPSRLCAPTCPNVAQVGRSLLPVLPMPPTEIVPESLYDCISEATRHKGSSRWCRMAERYETALCEDA